jgi:GT2 family glycosyltransferase/glycosyltransferase involved in cell wall biosynthesis
MRILLVAHGFPPAAVGGTEVYVEALASTLASGGSDDVFVLAREGDRARPEYSVRREDRGRLRVFLINNTFQACTSFEESYTNPALLRVAADLIAEIDPDVAHVHHLTCLSTGLIDCLSRRNAPVVLTLHDYWMLCHRGQLLDLQFQRCEGPLPDGCSRCIPAAALASTTSYKAARLIGTLPLPGTATAARVAERVMNTVKSADPTRAASADRLATMREAARQVDLVLAPSQTILSHFLAFGIPPDRIQRCDLGVDFRPVAPRARRQPDVLRIAFVGSLIPSKAPHVLLEAAALLPAGSVTVDLIGAIASYHGDDSYARRVAQLQVAPFVRHVGEVPHDRIADFLADVDVLVLPSVWIENSPLVIREAFAARIPVVASDLGGMAEMVSHERDGLLFSAGDSQALAKTLERLRREPGLLTRLRDGISTPMSIGEDAAALRATYGRLAGHGPRRRPPHTGAVTSSRRSHERRDAGEIVPSRRVTAVVLNYNTPDQTWLAVRSLQTSFDGPARIIVVDNGSADESVRVLRRSLNGIDIVETGKNLGFSGGCNVGISCALGESPDYVLLVNSDVVLAPDALGALVSVADRDRTAGVLAPLVLSRAEPGRIASAGISYSTRSGRMRHLGVGEPVSDAGRGEVREVDAVSGCVMLIRRGVFEAVGLLHEEYFFSFEDLEFCLRVRARGFRIVCVPDAQVYHEGCQSIGPRSPRRVYFATRNHLKLAADAAPSSAPERILRGGIVVGLNLAYVAVSPDAPLVTGLAAVARGTWHHLIGRYGSD